MASPYFKPDKCFTLTTERTCNSVELPKRRNFQALTRTVRAIPLTPFESDILYLIDVYHTIDILVLFLTLMERLFRCV